MLRCSDKKGEAMEQHMIPRVILAGTGSGGGKTTVTCAVLQALVNRGVTPAAFKCGPDYIDPMFHRAIAGDSANLDPFFFPENTLRYLLAKHAAGRDVNVIEGVMGYYDGLGLTDAASTYAVAKTTASPVVLIVNAKGAALSALAALRGFLAFRPDSGIRGVIFNHCPPSLSPALAEAVRREFGEAVAPLGCLPSLPDCALESRHLGLVTAAEVENLGETLQALAIQAERSLDLDGLVRLAQSAPPLVCDPVAPPRFSEPVRIAVARDRAFCFYYEDSLDLLRELGAELLEFSPLSDAALPENIDGLYLGGGYPEEHAARLSGNVEMLESVKTAVRNGLPCIAECGGFMYLTEAIGEYPMTGVLPERCFDAGKLTRFGYVSLTAKRDNLLCRAGEFIPAHEFHRWDCEDPGGAFTAEKPSGRRWDCAVVTERLYAGFPHFHFYANPVFALNFYNACLKEKRRHA